MIAIDTQSVQRDHREKYIQSRYDIPIKYYDSRCIISVFIYILKYWDIEWK